MNEQKVKLDMLTTHCPQTFHKAQIN